VIANSFSHFIRMVILKVAEQETTRLWRVRKTIFEMMHDRNYMVSQAELDMSLQQFKDTFGETINREELTIIVQSKVDVKDQLFVFFPPKDEKVSIKLIRRYAERMEAEEVRRAILVVPNELTPSACKILAGMAHKLLIETFREEELVVNITAHELVPKHVKLTPAEKSELLKKYLIKEAQLPRMQRTDPVARYFGLVPGDVVMIFRPSETAGRYVTYRYVI
jgi:DNA-directed RNA polymerase I, II, and III subunit RPABC1